MHRYSLARPRGGSLIAWTVLVLACTDNSGKSAANPTGGAAATASGSTGGAGATSSEVGGSTSGWSGSGGGTIAGGATSSTGGTVDSSGGSEPTASGAGSAVGGAGAATTGGAGSGETGGEAAASGGVSGGVAAGGAGAAAGTAQVGGAGAGAVSSMGGTETGGVVDRDQAPYPDADPSDCGESWTLVDNVCCAQYCVDDDRSESCSECGGNDSDSCVSVDAKACKSGKWPEVHAVTDDEPWHYSRSTHFGLTAAGACAYGLYSLCSADVAVGSEYQERCDAFCTAYPDLCADPAGVTLRGNYAAPQGNYYTQFWPSLPGDLDNYLACGECYEVVRTRPDGTEYAPGDDGYAPSVVLQIVDSCPCSANSKWCCGSGRNHCGEVSEFAYGCPLPPGPPAPPADRDPLPDESMHLDLSSIAMARLQTGDPLGNIANGVIPMMYRRVPCPVVGNTYLWLHPAGGAYWFSLSVVNSAGLGSIVSVEARLPSGEWVALGRDANYTSSRPQERYGAWVLPQGAGPFELPVSIRLTSPSGEAIVAEDVIKSWEPADPSQEETYYIDTGVQF